jgi:hypothetical protein
MSGDAGPDTGSDRCAKLLPDPAGVSQVDLGRQRNDHRGQVMWIGHHGRPRWQGGSNAAVRAPPGGHRLTGLS